MEAVSRKKGAHKMCRNCTKESKRRYKSIKNTPKKEATKAMREKDEEAITE